MQFDFLKKPTLIQKMDIFMIMGLITAVHWTCSPTWLVVAQVLQNAWHFAFSSGSWLNQAQAW
ncbi:MAG: hypothetical protein LBC53_04085 [Spirochaetaceae bacterium]|jgi:hypothetical protein|nr:hypothetical protein [Spirochaetaceae bacterium]